MSVRPHRLDASGLERRVRQNLSERTGDYSVGASCISSQYVLESGVSVRISPYRHRVGSGRRGLCERDDRGFDHRPPGSRLGKRNVSTGVRWYSRRPSSLIFSDDRFSAVIADQIERNSERDNVLEEKQAEIVHVMDAVNHDGVIRSRDQHAACGEEHAD